MSPLCITIVTPSYNQGPYLERNLRSVIEQEYPDLEQWVLDGGSKDESTDILARYAKDYPHLHWLSKRDRGQSDAVNKGFHRATGQIVGWINSDDKLAPGALHKVARYFEEHPRAMAVVGDLRIIDEDDAELFILKAQRLTHESLLNEVCSIVQPSCFFRRELIERAGEIDTHLHYAMDHEYFLRLTRFADIDYLPEILAEFRIQPDSKTQGFGAYRCSKDNLETFGRYGAPLWAKPRRAALYLVLTQPLRRIPWLRKSVRSLKYALGRKTEPHDVIG